jgi:hypothetical protein
MIHRGHLAVGPHEIIGIAPQAAIAKVGLPIEKV